MSNASSTPRPIHVIGGGLAGSEATWQIAQAGVPVILHEMRRDEPEQVRTDAHHTTGLAELVCSNSFRSDDWEYNAVGLLHAEMRALDSLIMASGDANQVPAGGALAVDRIGFSDAVTAKLEAHPLVTIVREEIAGIPPEDWDNVIVATGPLTSPALADAILKATGEESLSFFDAIAPILHADSIDFDVAWRQSRYDKEGPGGDKAAYVNCPMDKAQYEAFIDALLDGPKADFKEWENVPYFDGCLPIEVMAERGRETLRHGPMKPVGLTNQHNPTVKPYAIVQLRQDNALGTLFNMVGFQTKLKYGAQTDVFRMIPGLENAQFARLGGLHRNTFLNSPKLLDKQMRLKALPRLRFAGQVTGVEGYVESAAMGLLTGRLAAAQALGRDLTPPPPETAMGALVEHITGGHLEGSKFQPMNINYGLLPPLEAPKVDEDGKRIHPKERGRAKKRLQSIRALDALKAWRDAAA
ncbi:methylenetetrahydrofolate--tRNA-(uracil(54)-C(5))-methyltransferase (FADH(2)-oxidizing) TrmFO [Brevundimonas diminuta]|jgi:methylenetetrahydrofolate--tRNA-(uracil-5-)-methyltransferase|uniref:Methylenetetrahydrofolate--tRNA-(uracil-5-)-methyltransferase TrmFO n=1 Tax=Brevundimonas diminuta TaxID=293 RepID=A0A410NZD4_BREDI|nr:methylenetetrahydrofolate--tRNA-(uracil(54)-C(5))-methyltransferase (FADH(2)-oxidizing) TrmFO [Brevundimonas diminuta]MBD3573329.1 methylenetetrahydrofolate--tRNA-(uracil(54)-C(5))-methyltransferase (FADH(2)-oxidizing) TrmFO [Brevundimonas diminuta]QAT15294.1 methylenetetrahydrofolate--tRNA-(uracil(54)-C(5))-methyltransferase (FADH(2)-oxidizing) TrmFO [Brevundimonas diminuta]QQB87321.1 methylenetetrahydrofolate--tRNA-(uracil(54)-C(5))-methyltransferase (FADH(2)-oxidizing) TrmFO [Brevundimonas